MFDFLKNSRLVKAFLVVIALSFVYFGVGGLSMVRPQYVVEIGDTKISNFDIKVFLQRIRQVQDEGSIKEAYSFLQKRAYLIEGGKKARLQVSPAQINQIIKSEPSFRDFNGNFDKDKYRKFISTTYLSEALFQDELKKNILHTYVTYFINNNHIISDYQMLQYLVVFETKKETQSITFPIEKYKNQVRYTEPDLKSFYNEHQEAYQQDESIRFEYLHLTPEWMIKRINVSEEEIKNYYENNQSKAPQRMISHIVFVFPQREKFTKEAKLNLKKQAEYVLEQVKQQPERFSELAAKYSQDAATAQFGGSVGVIEKNAQYHASIEDAVFKLKTGQIYPEVVEAVDGFYIIKVDAALDWQSYNQDKLGIEYVLKYNQAKTKLATLRDDLSEASFNESKDLAKVSQQQLGENIVQASTGWVSKQDAILAGLPVEIISVLFDPLSISEKSNSEVISVGSSYWIVRVLEHRSARTTAFEEVKGRVIKDYVLAKAGELAVKDAENVFQQLAKGQPVVLDWNNPSTMSVEEAKSDFSREEYIKFLSTRPENGKPGYYLLNKRAQPMIVKVNSEQLNYPFSDEKKKLAYEQSKDMISKKNEIAILSYLYKEIKRKKGNTSLEL